MQSGNRNNAIIIFLGLLWLAITGTYAGWGNPWILYINLVVWLGLMLSLLFVAVRPNPVTLAIVGIMASILLSAAINDAWYTGLTQIIVWSGYVAVFTLAQKTANDDNLAAAAHAAFWVFLPLGLVGASFGWNSNIVSFNIVALAFLAWPIGGWVPLAAALGAALWLNSLGAILALLAGGGLLYAWPARRRWLLASAAAVVPVIILDGWLHGQRSFYIRLSMLMEAWQMLVINPVFGVGPGKYESINHFWHAHNTIGTTAAELGIIGLVALAGFIWVIVKRWPQLPRWAAALLLAVAVWSLFDEPLRFWGPGAMAMIALSRGIYV